MIIDDVRTSDFFQPEFPKERILTGGHDKSRANDESDGDRNESECSVGGGIFGDFDGGSQ